jgi:hypothetical protein
MPTDRLAGGTPEDARNLFLGMLLRGLVCETGSYYTLTGSYRYIKLLP